MCFGNFHATGGMCANCKVSRSCKKESLRRIKTLKERQAIQAMKHNTIERFSDQFIKDTLYRLIAQCSEGISTYRLAKYFKRNYTVNVSDTTIKNILTQMAHKDRTIENTGLHKKGAPTRWHITIPSKNIQVQRLEMAYTS